MPRYTMQALARKLDQMEIDLAQLRADVSGRLAYEKLSLSYSLATRLDLDHLLRTISKANPLLTRQIAVQLIAMKSALIYDALERAQTDAEYFEAAQKSIDRLLDLLNKCIKLYPD